MLVKLLAVVSLAFHADAACKSGWVSNPFGTCYKLETTTASWFEAKMACQTLGGDLADLDTYDKIIYMKGLRYHKSALRDLWMWISGHETNGNWAWTGLVKSSLSESDWFPGQPDNYMVRNHGQDCLGMDQNSAHFKWDDGQCNDYHPYICEMKDPEGKPDGSSSGRPSGSQIGGKIGGIIGGIVG